MTEDEAKTKWCPWVRHTELEGGSWNRATWEDGDILNMKHNKGMYVCTCLGSRCMAWRWLPLMADDAFKDAVIKAAAEMNDTSTGRHKAAQHVMANRALYGLPTEPFDGYCGLAGKP